MQAFVRTERTLVSEIHDLEDDVERIEQFGSVADQERLARLREMITDGKAALFVLQVTIKKYLHPDAGATSAERRVA